VVQHSKRNYDHLQSKEKLLQGNTTEKKVPTKEET
jgi:hypothetical protein